MPEGLKTLCFIGSDKNAGKTTALNFVYQKLKKQTKQKIVLSSIGINGESFDQLQGHAKPRIEIKKNDYVITAHAHLKGLHGLFEIIHLFSPPHFRKTFVLIQLLADVTMILEGPNEKKEILLMKAFVKQMFGQAIFILDGSIDRQFIAHPDISDEFYFAVLHSSRAAQMRKLKVLTGPLALPTIDQTMAKFIKENKLHDTKSLLFDGHHKILHHGNLIPFLDNSLLEILKNCSKQPYYLYLNGALTEPLLKILYLQQHLTLILDNFTLYLPLHHNTETNVKCNLMLLHPIKVNAIFLRDTSNCSLLELPSNIPVHNIFREAHHEIRI